MKSRVKSCEMSVAGWLAMAFVSALCTCTGLAATVSVDTPEFALSIKHDGVRESEGNEPLAYSPFWGEVTNGTVRLTQAKDGGAATPIVSGLDDEGTNIWKATQNGTYVLTHEVVTKRTPEVGRCGAREGRAEVGRGGGRKYFHSADQSKNCPFDMRSSLILLGFCVIFC